VDQALKQHGFHLRDDVGTLTGTWEHHGCLLQSTSTVNGILQAELML
jgi:hypothetical protein